MHTTTARIHRPVRPMTADDKPVRLPWEKTPWVDFEAASHKAVAAASATHTDPKSAVVASYAQRAFSDEIDRVRSAPSGERNTVLFKAGANLYELVYAGALSETEVDAALREACMANHYIQDDGESGFEKSLNSAKRRGLDNPRDLSAVGTKVGASFDLSDDTPKLLKLSGFQHLERGFWTERTSLQHVYLAALSGMCSPWAVLAHCVARVLALIPPTIVLPPLIGGTKGGSLNWFALIAASSAGGKGAAATIAEDLIPNALVVRNLGSGEGVVDAFAKPADKETGEPASRHESILFQASEIDSLTALGQRSGSTLTPTLRSAWSGELLGTSNRTASRMHLEAHSYRMTLVISGQPERCGTLLGEANGGMPQRFQWFPGTDSRITSETPPMPGALPLPPLSTWRYRTTLKVPYEAVELIKDERVRANNEDQNALDGHSLFVREKFAYALAVLDGRSEMDLADWRLSGIAMRVSDHTRAYAIQAVDSEQVEQATRDGKSLGVKRFAADEAQAQHQTQQRAKVARWCVERLTAAGSDGLTTNALSRASTSADRRWIPQALDWLADHGKVMKIDRRSTDRTDRWCVR